MARGTIVTVEGLGQRVTVRDYAALGGYTQERITLLLEKGQVVLEGERLTIERMCEGEFVARGSITALRYEG